jgi:hypothetical protein
MSTRLEDEVIRKLLLSSTFAMQLDESTDVANLVELLIYVRYAHGTFIEGNMLFCMPFVITTTGLDIF